MSSRPYAGDGNTGVGEGVGVSDAFVAKRVEVGGDYRCGRQAVKVAVQRREARVS